MENRKSSQEDRWYGNASENDKEYINFISPYVTEQVNHHEPLSSGEVRLTLPENLGKLENQTVHYNRSGYGWGPTTFWLDDEVKTKDGKKGKVLGNIWVHNLVLFRGNTPCAGYWAVKVGFDNHCKYYFVHELEGENIQHAK